MDEDKEMGIEGSPDTANLMLFMLFLHSDSWPRCSGPSVFFRARFCLASGKGIQRGMRP